MSSIIRNGRTFWADGTVMWAKVHKPDEKYGNYTLDFYPDDPDEFSSLLKDLNLGLKKHTGEDGPFWRLRRPTEAKIKDEIIHFSKPKVVQADGVTDEERLVGNGSHVTVKVETYKGAKGNGHRLEGLRVNSLVEYEAGIKTDADDFGAGMPPV